MKRFHADTRGLAALELALGMLLLVPLLLLLVEASKALTEYAQLQNASMEGARMLARQNGDTSGVESFVQSLFTNSDASPALDGDPPTVTVSPRGADNNVTVQVDHVFTPLFAAQTDAQGNLSPFNIMGVDPITLSARTIMALPATN